MRRIFLAAVMTLLSLSATVAQTVSPQQPETGLPAITINSPPNSIPVASASGLEEVSEDDIIRVNTTLVTVPFRVLNRKGKYISQLRQEDFRIYEDEVEQQIAYFAPADEPATVALVLDTSGSTKFRLKDIQEAALAFVDQLRPEDRVMVISFDDQITVLAESTNDRSVIREAIFCTAAGNSTRFYDAVDFVLAERLRRVTGRKAIVLFTDGMDTTSHTATFNSNLREAEASDTMIYTVDYGPRSSAFNSAYRSKYLSDGMSAAKQLRQLAEQTGGRAFGAESLKELRKVFVKVAEELRGQYSLGYYPKSAGQPGQRCRIKVGVMVPELVVRARDSYIYAASKSGFISEPRSKDK